MHYNIQINIQQVGEESVPSAARRSQDSPRLRRVVTEVLALKVVAGDEADAYQKAADMLKAATPSTPTGLISGGDELGEDDF